MPNFMDRISQKLEVFRIEQRYTKRRNRRSTLLSEARYVDGEYIYDTPSSPTAGSSTSSTTSSKTSSNFSFGGNKFGSLMLGKGSGRGEIKNTGTDGKRGEPVVFVAERELVLSPVEDLAEAQVIGRERERRWSGVGRGRKNFLADKRTSMAAVREITWEVDETFKGLKDQS